MTGRVYFCLNYCGYASNGRIFICPKCRYDHDTDKIAPPMPEKPATVNSALDCQHLWGMAEEEYQEHNHTVLLKLTCSHCEAVMYPNHLPRDMFDNDLPW